MLPMTRRSTSMAKPTLSPSSSIQPSTAASGSAVSHHATISGWARMARRTGRSSRRNGLRWTAAPSRLRGCSVAGTSGATDLERDRAAERIGDGTMGDRPGDEIVHGGTLAWVRIDGDLDPRRERASGDGHIEAEDPAVVRLAVAADLEAPQLDAEGG